MRKFFTWVCATLGLAAIFTAGPALAAEPLKVLLVTGGCCHDYPVQKQIISEGVSARANVTWTVVHDTNTTREHKLPLYENPKWYEGYDLVVHNECFGMVNDDAFVERIAAAHLEAGIPAVMLHCSTHSYRAAKTDAWRKTLGVSSYSHEKNRDLTVRRAADKHPIMQGFPTEWLDKADELYKVEKFWPTATSLAVAYGADTSKDHTCIWTNEVGKTRVFCTTLGHGNATMSSPVYLDLVTRGLLWAAGKLDENGKASEGYGANSR